jgi:hypothetical protein
MGQAKRREKEIKTLKQGWDKLVDIELPLSQKALYQQTNSCLPDRVVGNSRYYVEIFKHSDYTKLSIGNKDGSAKRDWRDFQQIKNELLGDEEEAVELYPAETRLIDNGNRFHLYSYPGKKFEFGMQERFISEGGPSQRPFRDGERPVDCIQV